MASGYINLEYYEGAYYRPGSPNQTSAPNVNNGLSWFLIGSGVIAEVIGGYLFNYAPAEQFSIVPVQNGLALRASVSF